MTEDRSKRDTEKERRLLFAVIFVLAGGVIVLIAGAVLIQENITNLRGTVTELKPLEGNIFIFLDAFTY